MQSELISIIIPIFNGANYIKNIVSAIKAQTYKTLEIIVVDDGSQDNTLDLCHKYMDSDKRFNIVSKVNEGVSSARNYGLRKATGKYIAFIDVDDYIFPEYISFLYKLLIEGNADMSCCGYFKMWDTEKIPRFRNEYIIKTFQTNEAIQEFLYRKSITGYPVLKLYKKSLIQSVQFPEEIVYGEDSIFTLYALQQCKKVIYGSRVLYIYYQHNASATHAVDYSKFQAAWEMHKKCILDYAKKSNKKIINAAYSKMFILSIDFCCRIWKEKTVCSFRDILLKFINDTDRIVLKDKKCKKFNRFLALLSCINTNMMIHICLFFNLIKKTLKFEVRHSL